jgi:hypothetical protein
MTLPNLPTISIGTAWLEADFDVNRRTTVAANVPDAKPLATAAMIVAVGDATCKSVVSVPTKPNARKANVQKRTLAKMSQMLAS